MRLKRVAIITAVVVGALLTGVNDVHAQETLWVKDETNQLTQETLDNITYLNEEVFNDYDIQPQIGVEIVNELPDGYYDMDEYKNERFEELGIGSKEHDSGILYVIAIEDREFGIETGYGVEPVVRDIEAQQILDDTIDHMVEYSETGEPEHLNNAVNQTVDTLETLLEKGNTGVLFEERAEQERLEKELEEAFLNALGKIALYGATGLLGGVFLWYVVRVIKELKKRKLEREQKERLAEQKRLTLVELKMFYEEGKVPFEKEYTLEDFTQDFEEDELVSTEQEYKTMEEDKLKAINKYRITNVENIIEKVHKNNPTNYYLRHKGAIQYQISENPTMLVETVVYGLDKLLDKEKGLARKLAEDVEKEVDDVVEESGVPHYANKDSVKKAILSTVKNKMNINSEGVLNLKVNELGTLERKKMIENRYKKELVEQYIGTSEEFRLTNYKYGSQDDFVRYAKEEMLGANLPVKAIVDENIMNKMLVTFIGVYLAMKKAEYKAQLERERKRKEQERREEKERLARIARETAYTSSSRNNRSSHGGGGFGGGFGGGSSGGGGASGGW